MKTNLKLTSIVALSLIVFLTLSCKKSKSNDQPNFPADEITDINQMKVPNGFNFETTNEVSSTVTLLSPLDEPLKGVRVRLMTDAPENDGEELAAAYTNVNGIASFNVELPTYLKEVVVNTDYLGIVNNVIVPVNNKLINVSLGGKNQKVFYPEATIKLPNNPVALGKNPAKYSFRLGRFTTGQNGGVPNYLELPNDQISAAFLADINATLPENRKVPQFNPEYISTNAERNINLTELCDVWITFVAEGAGYRNSLFYFVYPTNNKPTQLSQIDSLIAVFPNASANGSGGGLVAGNKVRIGRWGADTSIGFCIVANGWNGTTVGNGQGTYYSIRELNTTENVNLRDHTVLLNHAGLNRLLIGFEDLFRTGGGSDDDFNDLIIYATANPVRAISTNNVVLYRPAQDTDGDGIDDQNDEFPNDNQRALRVYYPNKTTFASVAFEDLWPSRGDYDLNDVVVNFQYEAVVNGQNQIKDLTSRFKLVAAGGIFKNAFSVEFPFNANLVQNITGNTLGLESGQTKAVLQVFANSKALIPTYNTLNENRPFVNTDTIRASFTLSTAQAATLGIFNPFIWIDEPGKGRGFEVHLPGKPPTPLANTSIFGTNADATNPQANIFYKTANNLPFAIAIPETFAYPYEKESIIGSHLRFVAWAQSGGTLFPEWYKNLTGYRNQSKIYVPR
ncbi:MAG: LruC domain-containing protein [Bacteroidia bacterium]